VSSRPQFGSRYHVVDEIAAGGMGVVLLALRTDMMNGSSAPVAIKQLHRHLIDNHDVVSSFVDEARIASRLVHPNVVNVHDVEQIDGELIIVMDYVEGLSLRELIRKRGETLPIPVVRRILVDSLRGLHAAHELVDEHGVALNVVHRDVSPHNLLVGINGITRVTDFGVALAVGRITQTKADGTVKGKLQYLSPEQVFRNPIDRRTDLFALGAVAWEVLTGKKLFDAPTEGETLAMIIRESIDPPSMQRIDVPLDLDETILRALEREPERRWSNALEMAAAIEAGGPIAPREELEMIVLEDVGQTLAGRRQRLAAAAASAGPVVLDPLEVEETMLAGPPPPPSHTGPGVSIGLAPPRQHRTDPNAATFKLRSPPGALGGAFGIAGRAISPTVLFVVASICVSGGLLVGFYMKNSKPTPKFSDLPPPVVAPMTPVDLKPSSPAGAAGAPVTATSGVILGSSDPSTLGTAPATVAVATPATTTATQTTPPPPTTPIARPTPPAPAPPPPPAHRTPRQKPPGSEAKGGSAPKSGPYMPDDL
jgi:eukaryotic-like serine/threonine-protein kinase